MKYFGYIYKITNLVNNKIYIGKTEKTVETRFLEHLKKGLIFDPNLDAPSHLYSAIHMYGVENFKVEEIDTADSREELNKKEKYWIKYFNSTNNLIGYNIASGGTGGNTIEGYTDEEIENLKQRKSKVVPWNKGLNKDDQLHYKRKENKQKVDRRAGWTEEKRKHHGDLIRDGYKNMQEQLSPEMKQISHDNRSKAAKKRAQTTEFKEMIYKHNKNNKWGAKPIKCIYGDNIYDFCMIEDAAKWLKDSIITILPEYGDILSKKNLRYFIYKIRCYIKNNNDKFIVYYTPGDHKKIYIDNLKWKMIKIN